MELVCIVGAGISGLISAKLCLENNLVPFIVEKTDTIGGVWKGAEGQIGAWNSMCANLSKTSSWISDHPWPKTAKEFPTRGEVLDYYTSFANKHGLLQFIHFNTSVKDVSRNEENYSVTMASEEGIVTRDFKFVILGTGFYSRLKDEIPGKERFKGVVLHSAHYREPSIFQGKKVLIVGNAYSSCDIASEACEYSESVMQIYRKPTYFLKKKIYGVPFECILFNILSRFHPQPLLVTKKSNEEGLLYIEQVFGNPGDILEELRITKEDLQNDFQNLNVHLDEYYESLKKGKISCIKGTAKEFSENGIILTDGREIPADVIILGTGYYSNYDYLSEDIKKIVNYDPKYQKGALSLFRSTIHPALPGLGFVGSFHGPFPGQFEIQAMMVVKWITGQLNVRNEELWEGVRAEQNSKIELEKSIFIYDFGNILFEYFRILEIKIDYEFLDSLGFRNGPFCAVFYWKDRPGQEELIREFVEEYKETYPEFKFDLIPDS